jgi:uncharacterized protein
LIIDSHAHLGELSGYYNYDTSLETLLKRMDNLQIKYSISSGALDLIYGEFDRSYEYGTMAYKKSGGRIMNYYCFNPCSAEKSIESMDKFDDYDIFKGIKIHPSWHKTFADDEKYEDAFIYANEKKLPIMCHTWTISLTNPLQKFSTPSRLQKYALKYPDVKIILAHSGGRYEGMCEALALAKECPNVYCDVAGDIYLDKFVETFVAELGSSRVLYGSDYSMMDQRIMLGVVMGADISIREKEDILYKNAVELFELDIEGGSR